MKYWKDPSEPITAFVKLFETAQRNEEEVRQGFDKIDQLIWFNYTQDGPSCAFHIDCRNHSFRMAAGKPADEPDLTLSLSADDAHLSWANKLNPVMAIARGKIKVKGSAVGLLRLAPKLGLVAKTYVSLPKIQYVAESSSISLRATPFVVAPTSKPNCPPSGTNSSSCSDSAAHAGCRCVQPIGCSGWCCLASGLTGVTR